MLQTRFLPLLPRIERHARIHFRHLRCPHAFGDAVAECIALAWKWFVRLAQRGRDAAAFVTTLATFAARAVHSGRRLCGQQPARDVTSPRARRRHGFALQTLPADHILDADPLAEALTDNNRSAVPDQVVFRCDFPAWVRRRGGRDRRLIRALMVGERTLDVARRFGLSPARVSQLRREFRADWLAFCDELHNFDPKENA